jgi:hypothetical protein
MYVMMSVFLNHEAHVDPENNRWRLSRLEWRTSMCFHTQITGDVRQLVEKQLLASASTWNKHKYAGLPSAARRLIVKAFFREHTGASNPGAKTVLGLP